MIGLPAGGTPISIRARLLVGAAVVLAAFLALAGFALEHAFADSVREARFARLRTSVYVLLAAAELDEDGSLSMPADLAEPRFSLPHSGLYANIANPKQNEEWQSASTVGLLLPFAHNINPGQWKFQEVVSADHHYLSAAYGVRWAAGRRWRQLSFSVLEDAGVFQAELAQFRRTLWLWLGGTGLLLLAGQTLLLSWGLRPLRRVAREIERVEDGEQSAVEGVYPTELAGLTNNLNTLIEQERARQVRYKDALGDLAHSLKTPLAVLRGALAQPDELAPAVEEQVARMDRIVQHQLGRAAASGAARFAPPMVLLEVFERITASLRKVYADKGLVITVDCPADLSWRIDEGDAFEVFGNLLDNAAKWAKTQVRITALQRGRTLHVVVEDDGPGFSDPAAALQRGVRLDEQVPGHGIGLTVVADIVAAHGGQIDIDRGEWRGGRVRVRLRAA
jgi:two-component system sensor histidine kinase PhoQ